jgi:hypothetical protein
MHGGSTPYFVHSFSAVTKTCASAFHCKVPAKKVLVGDLSKTISFLLNHITQQKSMHQQVVVFLASHSSHWSKDQTNDQYCVVVEYQKCYE